MKIPPIRAKRQAQMGATNDEPTIDCSSLIDLCFLLLIYFLVTHTIAAKEREIDMALAPTGGSYAQLTTPALQVSLNAEGVVSVGEGLHKEILDKGTIENEARELPLLNERLAEYARSTMAVGEPPMVSLHIDGDAKQQHLMDILNALVKQKIRNVQFHEFASD